MKSMMLPSVPRGVAKMCRTLMSTFLAEGGHGQDKCGRSTTKLPESRQRGQDS